TFLRSAYVVYDLDSKHIGLAQTKFNVDSSDVHEIGSDGDFGAVATAPTINVTPTAYKPIAPAPATQTPVRQFTEPAPFETRTLPGDPTSAPSNAAGVSNPAGAAASTSTTGAASRLRAGPIPDGLGDSLAVSAVAGAFVLVGALFGFM
ncbi:MAG: hypothetical protein INR71_13075, partial [Terriglobus roseus]|nr:hypothetical protein [Terriglobus roseus]